MPLVMDIWDNVCREVRSQELSDSSIIVAFEGSCMRYTNILRLTCG